MAQAPLQLVATPLAGAFVIRPPVFHDARGAFVKTYHTEAFREAGLPFTPREEFFSVSRRNVVRGLHFQTPPHAVDKLVYCPLGAVLDVIVDLRRASPTYGQTYSRELSAANREMLFVPIGFAHGFLALADDSMMVYQCSEVHAPAHDAGILWNSIPFAWPVAAPILSPRDLAFPALRDYASPF